MQYIINCTGRDAHRLVAADRPERRRVSRVLLLRLGVATGLRTELDEHELVLGVPSSVDGMPLAGLDPITAVGTPFDVVSVRGLVRSFAPVSYHHPSTTVLDPFPAIVAVTAPPSARVTVTSQPANSKVTRPIIRGWPP